METNYIFTRAEIKQRAKNSLSGKWGIAIGSFVLAYAIYYVTNAILGFIYGWISSPFLIMSEFVYVLQIVSSISSLLSLLLIYPIFVGLSSSFLKISRNEPVKISNLFSQYNNIWKILGIYLLILIKTLLWSLLFIIPGIIASYRYSQAFYILIDNPEKGVSQCIKESTEMMRGKKADLFVLGLSFIGWGILTIITLGIAGLYVFPYMQTTYANFYNQLVNKIPTDTDDFNVDEDGFYDKDQAAEAVFTPDESAVADDNFAEANSEPETTIEVEPKSDAKPVTDPVEEPEQEYGFDVEE